MKKLIFMLALIFTSLGAFSQGNPVTRVVGGKTYEVHKVVAGETLYKIAKKHACTVTEIQTANPTVKVLHPEDEILIPQKQATVTTPEPEVAPASVVYKNHSVKKGETLSQIARDYHTTVEELKRINKLGSAALKIGQIIKVPDTSVNTKPADPVVTPANGDSDQKKPDPNVEVKPEPVKQPEIKVDDKTNPSMPVSPKVTVAETAVEKEETATATIISDKMDQTRTFVMHPYLPKGSIIVVINQDNGKMAYCRVIDNIASGDLNGAGIAITKAVAEKIGLSTAGGSVKIKYAAP